MKSKIIVSLVLSSIIFIACDDNTDEIGSSLIDNVDRLEISTQTYKVSTRSIIADSVYSRNTTAYLGRTRDPETGAYITSDFSTQFYVLPNVFPPADSIYGAVKEYDETLEKDITLMIADSCDIMLGYTSYYGDSLSTMKLTAYEMSKPMSETKKYYSNYDPEKDGMIRKGGVEKSKVYTLTDLNSGYNDVIRIKLDKEYTDKDGKKYNNYGTFLMQKYYSKDSVLFKDPYKFIQELVPGFYFKNKGGLGSMAYVSNCQLNIYYKMKSTAKKVIKGQNGKEDQTITVDTFKVGASKFYGTEEIMQSTRISNDNKTLEKLVSDNSCTYIKSPAGIFTEMTLPVEEIMKGHENDTINSAKITLTRLNNNVMDNKWALDVPQTLLMIPKSELYSFFENNRIADYKTSFLANYNSQYNTYTFNNIGSLIKALDKADKSKEDWNKVVIIPVTATYSETSSQNELTKVEHNMSMTSTRLIGGKENPHEPITITVIYSKFK